MVNRFFVTILTLVLVAGAVLYIGFRVLKSHNERNEAIRNQKKADISVTITEGRRREEIAAQLADAGITDYAGFIMASDGLEGKLFPDTYRFFPNTPANDVVNTLTANFTTRTGDLHPTADQLILASIVEREAKNDTDRAVIAGVYQNRLDQGMPLGSDPTVQYAKDTIASRAANSTKSFKFWSEITQADYQSVNSPFNTYLKPGLPPAPICNPGRQSILAAMNPAHHDYLYFLYKGEKLLLARTLEEHNANAQQ